MNNYDSQRNIAYQIAGFTPVQRQAQADYQGKQLGVSLGIGYDMNHGAFDFGIYGRANYLKVDVDAFREQGAKGLDLALDGFNSTSITTALGAQLSRTFNTSKAVLVPQMRLEWEHEWANNMNTLQAQFVADPTATTFDITTEEPDRDYFRFGLGMSAVFPHGLSSFINYSALVNRENFTFHTIDLGLRLEF
ncbi:outer membrane autotransporter barrel domain-containing protein [Allochromatium warmingii]|uniref:Outer membrane autotransporter barrel domain-containing protein n=1 Tax=Allochromatium warmingii TaxID=61595 RepID=A0A1H3J9E0_ALLWA|nr:autotransporter outer membrane beta-barrel domain-containing protein [Allochromatium warmingii]SDY36613.1 outer membrane autotransporter barrel domain-containing protein [Allochromatium warmingii]